MKIKKAAWIVLLIVLCVAYESLTVFVRALDMQADVVIMFAKNFLLGLALSKFYPIKPKHSILIGLGTYLVLYTFIIILPTIQSINYETDRLSDIFFGLPNVLAGLAGWLGIYLTVGTTFKKFGWAFSSVFFIASVLFYIQNEWYYDYIFYQNLNAKNELNYSPDLVFTDKGGQQVMLDSNTMYVLDFWHSRCYVCFEKFPEFDALYKKFKDKKGVAIYSINKPLDIDTAYNVFEKTSQYQFPTLKGPSNVDKTFDIRTYPTILIVKNNNILFRGSAKNASTYMENYKD